MIKHNCSSQSSFTNDKYCIWTIHSARRGMASGIDRQLRWQPGLAIRCHLLICWLSLRFGSSRARVQLTLHPRAEILCGPMHTPREKQLFGRRTFYARDMRPDHWSATLYCTWHLALYHWAIGAGLYWLSLARLFRIGALAELCSAEGDYKSIKNI